MDEYDGVRRGKLILKGVTKSKKRKHKSSRKDGAKKKVDQIDADALDHEGWWRVTQLEEAVGGVAIEFGRSYVATLDSGLLALGPPRDKEGPAPEEILTAVPAGTRTIAFKSGYGKYMGVDGEGRVTARADAVGPREQWEPVWEDGKMAILSSIGAFLSIDPGDDSLVAKNTKASTAEHCILRSQNAKVVEKTSAAQHVDDSGNLGEVEENYVRMFQKFQDKKVKINKDSRDDLVKAKTDGNLHEALLDRRSKMKADRYCK